ncbi:MAG: hypothetical protein KDB62_10325 [Solirubrobacterales bacterium]|nr:hypothetical protein [Solirubrobacterales bacterium]
MLVVLLALVLVGCGILLGALVISSDDDSTATDQAVDRLVTDSAADNKVQQAERAAATTAAISDAALKASEAENQATVETASAWLAYLQGVASLNQANRQIALAAAQKSKQQQVRRLVQAQALARSAVLGARVNQRVRNVQVKARLEALQTRAAAVQQAAQRVQQKVAKATGKAEQAAQRQVNRLNRRLQRGARRLEQQLRRALRAGGRELKQQLRAIERQLKTPIAIPQAAG